MELKKYLNMETEYLISHLTLDENVNGEVDDERYQGLYHRFYQKITKGFHLLTYSNDSDDENVEIYLVTNELAVGDCNKIRNNRVQLQVQFNSNSLQLAVNIRQKDNKDNNEKVPISFNLKDKHTSFELSQLLKQKKVSIHFITWQDGILYKERSLVLPVTEKIKSAIVDCIEMFLSNYSLEDQRPVVSFDDLLIQNQAEYVIIPISREDIEQMKVSKYAKMLKVLYPNVFITHALCSSVDMVIKGYEDDHRELWQIPEVRKFIIELNKRFDQWFYFLDKNSELLYCITMCLCGKGFGEEDKYSINDQLYNDFINNQLKNLNEVCYYLNDQEKFNEVKDSVFDYYKGYL